MRKENFSGPVAEEVREIRGLLVEIDDLQSGGGSARGRRAGVYDALGVACEIDCLADESEKYRQALQWLYRQQGITARKDADPYTQLAKLCFRKLTSTTYNRYAKVLSAAADKGYGRRKLVTVLNRYGMDPSRWGVLKRELSAGVPGRQRLSFAGLLPLAEIDVPRSRTGARYVVFVAKRSQDRHFKLYGETDDPSLVRSAISKMRARSRPPRGSE